MIFISMVFSSLVRALEPSSAGWAAGNRREIIRKFESSLRDCSRESSCRIITLFVCENGAVKCGLFKRVVSCVDRANATEAH